MVHVRTQCTCFKLKFQVQLSSRTRVPKYSSPLVTRPGELLSFHALNPGCCFSFGDTGSCRCLDHASKHSTFEYCRILEASYFGNLLTLTASGAYETKLDIWQVHSSVTAINFLIQIRCALLSRLGACHLGPRLTSFLAEVHLISHSASHMKQLRDLSSVKCISYCISPILPVPRQNLCVACHAWTGQIPAPLCLTRFRAVRKARRGVTASYPSK